jgi:hypothetical protein
MSKLFCGALPPSTGRLEQKYIVLPSGVRNWSTSLQVPEKSAGRGFVQTRPSCLVTRIVQPRGGSWTVK